jgi:hypothetical protein
MSESDFENQLRRLRPSSPSRSLEGRIAAALPKPKARPFAWCAWLGERLLWTAGGAVAAWMISLLFVTPPASAPVPASPVPRVSEEPIAWSDDGVQLIDGKTPARMLRRLVMERHRSADGSAEVRVPREDVILVPVALR